MPFTQVTMALLLVGGMASAQAPATPMAAAEKAPSKASFAYAHKAITSLTEANITGSVPVPWGGTGIITRLSLATHVVSHGFDHSGQMVVYLRMNGIIPPASRK